jgi:hypothetical protein
MSLCALVLTSAINGFWARGGAVGWGTALQAGISQFRLQIVSLEFFIDIILPEALWPWGRLNIKRKCVPRIFAGEWRRPMRRADNLTTFMYRLSWNLEAWNSWDSQSLSMSVQELLYLYMKVYVFNKKNVHETCVYTLGLVVQSFSIKKKHYECCHKTYTSKILSL